MTRVSLISLAFVLVWQQAAFGAGNFMVRSPRFSVSVDSRNIPAGIFKDGNIIKSQLKNGRLYFSFVVMGAEDAIGYLKANGELPVHVTVWSSLGKLQDYEIGIEQDDWDEDGDALIYEAENDGVFTWRTKLWIGQINHSILSITIDDASGNRINEFGQNFVYEGRAKVSP